LSVTVVAVKVKFCEVSPGMLVELSEAHPTGDPSPSSEDLAITRRLREAGEVL
jgi:DNA repair protein RadC